MRIFTTRSFGWISTRVILLFFISFTELTAAPVLWPFYPYDNVVIGSSGALVVTNDGVNAGTISVTNGSGLVDISGGTISASSLSMSGAGSLSLSNALSLGSGSLSVTGTGATVLAGNVIAGALVQSGTNVLTLSGSNSFSSVSVTSNATVIVDNAGAFGSAAVTLSGAVLSSSLSSNALLNPTVITGGGLTANITNTLTLAGGLSGTGTLSNIGSGTLMILGSNSYSGPIVLNAGTLAVSNNSSLGTGTITFASNSALAVQGSTTLARTVVMASNAAASFNVAAGSTLTATNLFSGAGTLVKTGAGTMSLNRLGSSNSYTGGTVVSQGTLIVTSNSIGGAPSAPLVVDGTLTINSLGTSVSVGSFSGNGTIQASNGNTMSVGNGGYSSTFGGTLGGGFAFVKAGAGTLTLTGNSTNTGSNSISAGSIQIGNGGSSGSIGSGSVVLGTNTSLIFNRRNTAVVSNAISGTGTLVQNGSGTTVLIASNTYSRGTIINAWTLQVGNGGSSGLIGSGAVTNNATLLFNRSDSPTFSNFITGTGSLIQSGAGTVTLTGSNSFTGGTYVTKGTLAARSLGTGALTLSGTSSNQATFQSPLSSGTLTLGAINFNGYGTMALNSNTVVASTDVVTINGSNNFLSLAGVWNSGTNLLISGSSIIGNNIALSGATFGTNTIPLGSSLQLGRTTYAFSADPSSLYLTVAGSAWNLVWTGGSGTWDTNSSAWIQQGAGANSSYVAYDNVTIATNAVITVVSNGVSAGVVTITNSAGTVAIAGGAVAATGFTIAGNGTVSIGSDLALGNGTISVLGSGVTVLSNNIAASLLNQSGAGTLTLNGSNTINGANFTGGATAILHDDAALGSATVSLADDSALVCSANNSMVLSNSIAVTSGKSSIENGSSSVLTLAGTLNKTGTVLTLTKGSFSVTGNITGNSGNFDSDLVISNATVTLSGSNNDYYGPTYVVGGSSLQTAVPNALPKDSILHLGSYGDPAGITNSFNLGGNDQTIAGLVSEYGSKALVTNSSPSSVILSLLGNSDFSGSITGEKISLVIGSNALVTMRGTNIYDGSTFINEGTLNLSINGQLSKSTNLVLNSGTLFLGGQNQINTNATVMFNGGTIALTDGVSSHGSQTFNSLTLTRNSILDFGNILGNSTVSFMQISGLENNIFNIYNWKSSSDGTSHLYDLSGEGSLSSQELANVQFYSDNGVTSLGVGVFQGSEIVPVPEPSIIASGLILLLLLTFSFARSLSLLNPKRSI